jgi:hypothetical protein
VQIGYQYERLKYHLYNFWLLDSQSKRKFFASKYQSLVNRTKVWRGSLARLFQKAGQPNRQGLVNMAEIWRKHDDIAEAYVSQKYPGKLIQFRPRRDYRCNLGPEYIADEVIYRIMPVYPAGMMASPFVQQLARELASFIDQGLKDTSQN